MDRTSRLRLRHAVARAARGVLDDAGYVEIHAPLLARGTCSDAHIDSFEVEGGYLVTSTEYPLKRLLAEGVPAVYSLTQNFRRGELGDRHNPEFTMLEWGRRGARLGDIEAELGELLRAAVDAALATGGRPHPSLGGPLVRTTVADALRTHAGVSFSATMSLAELLDATRAAGLDVPAALADDRTAVFTWLLDLVQPRLGATGPELLVDWPAYTSTSAPVGPAGVTERSELFVAGIEVADGFPFLRDAALQRAQLEEAQRERVRIGKATVRLDERYLEAVSRLPEGAGMALGFDRLVMLAAGVGRVEEVLAFGWDVR